MIKQKLDYKKMVEMIDELVNTDFCADMEMKQLPKSKPYTKEEITKMVHIIGDVYAISHCLTCSACNVKFRK